MINRVGQLWELGEELEWKHIATGASPLRLRILVVESVDKDNGRTLQKFYYIRNGQKDAYGDDLEYEDFPWERRSERKRIG